MRSNHSPPASGLLARLGMPLLPRVRLRQFLLFGLLSAAASLAGAAAEQPVFTAEKQDYDMNSGETVLFGGACVVLGDQVLRADQIRYSTEKGTAVATGNVVFTSGSRRIMADRVEYHFKDGTYIVDKPRLGDFPLYLRGSRAEGSQDKMVISDAEASFLEPGPWTPTLAASTLTYDEKGGRILSAQFPRFGVGSVHPLAVPKFDYKVGLPLRSFLSLMAGYRGNLGAFIEPGLRLPLLPGWRLGADIGMYSKRGLMFGPGGDYAMGQGTDDEVKGHFRSGFINDYGDRSLDILGRNVPSDRSFVSWEHHQKIGPRLTIDGTLGYWSDSEILRDFRPGEFFNTQVPDTYLESVYTGANYHISLFGRFQPNSYHDVQERLPELRLDYLPTPLALGIYQRFTASVARLREDPPTGASPALMSDRSDAYYALTRSFTPREWLNLTAVAGGRITHYANTTGAQANGGYTRTLGELGFDASLRMSGTFDYKNERWKINGLRHLLTPRISYRYIPEAEQGRRFIPQIDRESFSTYLPQLGLGDIRHIDDMHATNTLRVSVENTLQTQDAGYGSRDLASLILANDFHFDRQPGQNKTSETNIGFGLMPATWLRFDAYQSIAPQNLQTREFNTGLTIHDGDIWALRLSTHYLSGDISEYIAEYMRRLNEVYSVFTRLHYDYRLSRFNEQTYGLRQILGRTWSVRYSAMIYSGPRREGKFDFHVQVETLGF
ncbi:MAG: LPS assembly protein LptD [Opitutaceae bacterium]